MFFFWYIYDVFSFSHRTQFCPAHDLRPKPIHIGCIHSSGHSCLSFYGSPTQSNLVKVKNCSVWKVQKVVMVDQPTFDFMVHVSRLKIISITDLLALVFLDKNINSSGPNHPNRYLHIQARYATSDSTEFLEILQKPFKVVGKSLTYICNQNSVCPPFMRALLQRAISTAESLNSKTSIEWSF